VKISGIELTYDFAENTALHRVWGPWFVNTLAPTVSVAAPTA
jgi:hypothetical protein